MGRGGGASATREGSRGGGCYLKPGRTRGVTKGITVIRDRLGLGRVLVVHGWKKKKGRGGWWLTGGTGVAVREKERRAHVRAEGSMLAGSMAHSVGAGASA